MQFKTYTKQKLSIQAFQYTGINGDLPEEFRSNPQALIESNGLSIQTLEGVMRVNIGDWVIRGIKGEYYPCKPDIFDKSYKATQDAPSYLPDHMQRVYMEHKDLHERLVNLVKYRVNGFPHASPEEKSLLVRQEALMESLEWTLRQRLSLYGPSQETKITLIYARSLNNVIGQDGKLPWNIRGDIQHFKDTTLGHTVIMGSKTFESLGCKPLQGRTNIVFTGNPQKYEDDLRLHLYYPSLEEAIKYLKNNWVPQVFIIGGKRLLEEGLQYADEVRESVINLELHINEGTVTVDMDMQQQKDFRCAREHTDLEWGKIQHWVRKK